MEQHNIADSEDKKEYFDAPEVLDEKVTRLAEMILTSKHFVSFTGAGLSTAAGIPDFRSTYETKNDVGPGAWEIRAKKEECRKAGKAAPVNKAKGIVGMAQAHPTKAHMSLVELMNRGMLKHIISQNTDGLHRKSGVPADKISEVHGNRNKEECMKCGRDYMRDFHVRNSKATHEHKTGRKCDDPKCKGDLKDTIINFGENLREEILNMGFAHGSEADLMVCVGSSMRVNPAAEMAGLTAQRGKNLVIINLMKTPLDQYASLVINGKCQVVFELLMKKLQIEIPAWNITRSAKIALTKNVQGKESVQIQGIDTNNLSYDYFKGVSINNEALTKMPLKDSEKRDNAMYKFNMTFQGHYKEPNLQIAIPRSLLVNSNNSIKVDMIYNPRKLTWEFVMSYNFSTKEDLEII
jgi:NAD-dependent SIR2 family protein deacetylase